MNESLIKFWQDWKNVIIITVLVIINITSLTWAPLLAQQFKSDPAEVESLAKNIQDTLWLIVFIYAAQIIFSNRRKRIEAKKQAEAAAAAAAGEDVAEAPAEQAAALRAAEQAADPRTADQPVDLRASDWPMRAEGPMRAPRPPVERRRRLR